MTLRAQPKFKLRFQPWQRPFHALRSLSLGAIAISGAALLPGSGANAGPPSAIGQPHTPKATPAAIAERSMPLVLLADLVSQPERWQGRPIRTIGRLQPGPATMGCTKMACAFPDTARLGDQQPCNRCFGSAVLQDDQTTLALAEVRCQGIEILTYRGVEPVDRTMSWTGASFDSRTLSLDRPYAIIGTLRPQTTAGTSDASDSAAAPAYVLQVQSIEPVETWRCSFCSPRSVHDHSGSVVSQGTWLQPIN